jgi:hypothetical protein
MRALLACLLFTAACRPLKLKSLPREPTSERHGIVAFTAVLEYGRSSTLARDARFARLGPKDALEEPFLRANYENDGVVYLVDAPPGRYAPVSAMFLRGGLKTWVKFDESLTKRSAQEVPAGEAVYLGNYLFVQKKTGWTKTTTFKDVDVGRSASEPALAKAKSHFAGTLWAEAVERAIRRVKPPSYAAAVATPGNKVTPKFTYKDEFLHWGKPNPITGGLEWKQPQDYARIALVVLTPGMRGYRPKDEYLKFLRDAGSPEDSHVLKEELFSGKPAYTALYTTYFYPEGNLAGSAVRTLITETVYVPDGDANVLLVYRARKKYFDHFHKHFDRFRASVVLQ